MSDPETRDAIADVIKEHCALRSVLTKKPCPYFGASGSCLSCTYNWVAVAVDVRKLAERRRASYEQEKEKVKALTAELEESRSTVTRLEAILLPIGAATKAAQDYVEELEQMKAEATAEAEETDEGQGEGQGSAGREG